jgi:FkbM family methyltransferase
MPLKRLFEFSRWHIEPHLLSALIRTSRSESLVDLGLALLPERFAVGLPICYSVGVGEDIDFERRLSDRCAAKQWLFDPTPRTAKFMSDPRNAVLGVTFVPIGIWKEDCVQTFHAPSNPNHVSHSIVVDAGSSSGGFTAECRTIRSVMQQYGHDHIDVLKLNVEGAEDFILQSVLDAGVRPSAILVTWEGHAPLAKAVRWTKHLRNHGWDFLGRKGWYFTYARASGNR